MKSFQIMGRILKATWEDLFLLVSASLVWWIGVLLIVTAGPATMGLYGVTNRLANYRRSNMEFFWSEARRAIGRSWVLLGIILGLLLLILFNIWFYGSGSGWLRTIAVAWWWVLLLFFMIAQYLFPLLNQQNEPDVRQAVRNAFVLAMRSPLYTLLSLLFQIILFVLCVALVLPILVLLPGLIALSSNFMMAGLLQEMGLAEPPPTLSDK